MRSSFGEITDISDHKVFSLKNTKTFRQAMYPEMLHRGMRKPLEERQAFE